MRRAYGHMHLYSGDSKEASGRQWSGVGWEGRRDGHAVVRAQWVGLRSWGFTLGSRERHDPSVWALFTDQPSLCSSPSLVARHVAAQ